MINLKKIITPVILLFCLAGCSYITNEIEADFNDRTSFSGRAIFDGNSVDLEWDEIDNTFEYQIFRTTMSNDEFSEYKFIGRSVIEKYSELIPSSMMGIYYYRIAAISRSDQGILDFDKVSGPVRVVIE